MLLRLGDTHDIEISLALGHRGRAAAAVGNLESAPAAPSRHGSSVHGINSTVVRGQVARWCSNAAIGTTVLPAIVSGGRLKSGTAREAHVGVPSCGGWARGRHREIIRPHLYIGTPSDRRKQRPSSEPGTAHHPDDLVSKGLNLDTPLDPRVYLHTTKSSAASLSHCEPPRANS